MIIAAIKVDIINIIALFLGGKERTMYKKPVLKEVKVREVNAAVKHTNCSGKN
ncbi:MAG: hypothetical protein SPL99_01080 [Catonella sp.]|nr:hypothetical protein [Catonella sp.]MDY6356302.1 hypothetical protein [Catonella sp.]